MTIINVYVFLLTFYGWLNDSEAGLKCFLWRFVLTVKVAIITDYFYRTHVFAMLALLMNWQRKHFIVFKNFFFSIIINIFFPFFRVFNSVCLLEGSHCYYPWPDQKWLRVNFHMHKLSNAEELETDLLLTKQRLQSHRWSVIKYNQRRVIKCHCHLLHKHKWMEGRRWEH